MTTFLVVTPISSACRDKQAINLSSVEGRPDVESQVYKPGGLRRVVVGAQEGFAALIVPSTALPKGQRQLVKTQHDYLKDWIKFVSRTRYSAGVNSGGQEAGKKITGLIYLSGLTLEYDMVMSVLIMHYERRIDTARHFAPLSPPLRCTVSREDGEELMNCFLRSVVVASAAWHKLKFNFNMEHLKAQSFRPLGLEIAGRHL